MPSKLTQSRTVRRHGRPLVVAQSNPFLEQEYWQGLIKMSLSRFFILCVLHRRPMHGYEIAREVERVTKGCCSPAEGTIYPVLREFEQAGLVTVEAATVRGRPRKVYTLTAQGRQAFDIGSSAWMEATKCLIDSREMVRA